MNIQDNAPSEIDRLIERGQLREAHAAALISAKAGVSSAQITLGWLYQLGKGVAKDFERAKHWYRSAIGPGSPKAEFCLGTVYWNESSFREAIDWFQVAASQGYSPAAYHLARMYRHGIGVVRDQKLAQRYVEEAATAGHLYARRDIARDMLKGREGFMYVPLGLFRMFQTAWVAVRVASRNTTDERFLRL